MNEISTHDIEIKLLLEAIFLKYNYDFRQYSMASVKRRVDAALTHFEAKTISILQERLLRSSDFFVTLLQYLTVSTTEMFRDPTYFISLRKEVFPHLSTYPSLKFWVAGCSTGEEVYSLAIALDEEGLLKKSLIYATDINPFNLKNAEKGIYRVDQIKKYDANYRNAGGKKALSDYFHSAYDSVEMHPRLRKNIVFADHSLATDSVFCEVQMVSCRNVLIYFEKSLQDRAVGLFHESLSREGFFGMGEKESLRFSKWGHAFEEFLPSEKIYRRVEIKNKIG